MADRVAVPSLGVQLRAPPGGDVCSLARRILVRRWKGLPVWSCLRLVRGL